MLWKRLAVLVAAAMMMLTMFVASAPAFAQELGSGACDPNPGESQASSSPYVTPPLSKPGVGSRDPEANEHDPSPTTTGRAALVDECA